jgi:cytochrome P450
MLVRDAAHHHRNLVMQRSKAVLGEGLLTSEEPLHMRQRRLAQPAFHRQRIAAYGEVIGGLTVRMTSTWKQGSTFDVRDEMLLLALRIVGKTLFDTEVDQDVHKFAAAVDSFQGFLPLAFVPFSAFVQRLPIPAMRRIRTGREELDALIYSMIRERRADPVDRGDLLSMLLSARDPESDDPEAGMSDTLIRDECLTILLAGLLPVVAGPPPRGAGTACGGGHQRPGRAVAYRRRLPQATARGAGVRRSPAAVPAGLGDGAHGSGGL